MNKCRICLKLKPLSEFSIRKESGKHRTECRKCLSLAATKRAGPDRPKYEYKWRQSNPLKVKGTNLKKFWPGASAEQALMYYQNLQKIQDSKCAICKKPETSRSSKFNHIRDLSVDHCSLTGKVRGLLCNSCNTGIGNLKHCLVSLESAIIYLKENT